MATVHAGRETKGSRYHLQNLVNDEPDLFDLMILAASPTLIASGATTFDWKSPLKANTPEDHYHEYRDDFLSPLGLQMHEARLRRFWPKNGPQWDALASFSISGAKACLLVEAKAYPEEANSDSSATAPESISTIKKAFSATQAYMGISQTDWTVGHYQLANRLAFLYFLCVEVEVPAWLVLVNFVNDTTHRPTDLPTWLEAYGRLFASLGVTPETKLMNRIVTLFPVVTE